MRKKILFLLCSALLYVQCTYAATFDHRSGFKVWYPDGWEKVGAGRVITITNKKKTVTGKIVTLADQDLHSPHKQMEAALKRFIRKPQFKRYPKEKDIHGLGAIRAEGTGLIKNSEVQFQAQIVLHEEKTLLLLLYADEKNYVRYYSSILQFFEDIHPLLQ